MAYSHRSFLCKPLACKYCGMVPVCHGLLRKMRNSQSDVCCAQAGGKLTLAEQRETAREKR